MNKNSMDEEQLRFVRLVLPRVVKTIEAAAQKWRTKNKKNRGGLWDHIYSSLVPLRLKLQEKHGFVLRVELVWRGRPVFTNSTLLELSLRGRTRSIEVWAATGHKQTKLPFTKKAGPSARSRNLGGLGTYDTATYLKNENHQRMYDAGERRTRSRENNE